VTIEEGALDEGDGVFYVLVFLSYEGFDDMKVIDGGLGF